MLHGCCSATLKSTVRSGMQVGKSSSTSAPILPLHLFGRTALAAPALPTGPACSNKPHTSLTVAHALRVYRAISFCVYKTLHILKYDSSHCMHRVVRHISQVKLRFSCQPASSLPSEPPACDQYAGLHFSFSTDTGMTHRLHGSKRRQAVCSLRRSILRSAICNL